MEQDRKKVRMMMRHAGSLSRGSERAMGTSEKLFNRGDEYTARRMQKIAKKMANRARLEIDFAEVS